MSKYPSYQEVEAPWIGCIPEHWGIVKTGRVFNRKKEINEGMKCENRLALTMRGVIPRDLDDVDGLQSAAYDGYQIFEKDDIAFKLIDLENIKTSRVGHVGERGIMSPAYIRLEPTCYELSRFGYWYFTALYWLRVFNNMGGGIRQALGPAELCSIPFPLPPRDEQIAIAAFLDHETGKIDELIAEQEKLIALLDEKRQTVISHAVTKGLNPNVEMKDSAIEWLGEVPAHWDVKRLKDVSDCFPSNIDKHAKEGEIPVRLCNYTDVYKNDEITEDLDLMVATAPAHQIEKFTLRSGDVIITKDSETPDDIARPAYVPNDMEGVVCGYHLTMIRSGEHAHGRFIARYFDTYAARAYFHVSVNGFTRVGLGQAALGSAPIAMPPISEQRQIAEYLYQMTKAMDKLRADSKETIALLKERRSALISAAVTGKIDVRNHPAAVAALIKYKEI